MTNAAHDKLNTYSKIHKAQAVPNGNSRDTDSRALAACARRLDDACAVLAAEPKSKPKLASYCDAIRHNQRLWTIFQVALCDPQNPLPQHLKIILLNLSRYVDKTSFAAIGKFRPDLVGSLIDINRMIAAGLTKQSEVQAPIPQIDMAAATPTSLTTSA